MTRAIRGPTAVAAMREGHPPAREAAAADPAARVVAPAARKSLPDAMVIAAFPPGAGAAGILGAEVAASLALIGHRVRGVCIAEAGGEAHLRLDFATARGLRGFERDLAGRHAEVLVIDPAVLMFRVPRRAVHVIVAAIQLGFLWRLLRGARRVVLVRREPRGFWPTRSLARLVLGQRGAVVLDPEASFAARHVALARALGGGAAAMPCDDGGIAASLAGLGPETAPPATARLIAEAAAIARREHPAACAAIGREAARAAPPGGGGHDPASAAAPLPRDLAAIAEAPDPTWSAGGIRVTRLMVHMRAALRALPGLRPGRPRAARRLVAWSEGPMRRLAGRGLPHLLGGAGAPAAAGARLSGRVEAWWSRLSRHGDLAAPLAAAPAPDPAEVEALAAALGPIADAIASGDGLPAMEAQSDGILASPVAAGAGALSGLEFALGLMSGAIDAAPDCGAGRHAAAARELVAGLAARRPGLARFATAAPARPAPEITLIGFTEGGSGLAENMRMTCAALGFAGLRPVVRSLEQGLARAEGPRTHGGEAAPPALLRPARLVHVNADLVPQVLLEPRIAAGRDALNIGFLLWEFGALPEAHRLALDMLDEAWCPTEFVADAYRAAGRLPVHRIGKAVTLGAVEPVGRAALGLPEGPFLFLVTFDFHSSVERKNPLAAVRAFRRAFPPARRDVCLVIKTTDPARGHWGDPNRQWQAILDIARHDARIVILAGVMPRSRYFALMRAADCLVSPHRAEGFGYGPAQAMLLGRPSIVTDWSGTRDFCTEATSFPVPARLIPVRRDETILPVDGAVWAAIDEDALAATMREVAGDPATAGLRAAAGGDLMRQDYSLAAQAARCLGRLRALGIVAEAG